MPRVDNFLLTSDFDSLKNDDYTTAVLTVPASQVIAAGATANFETNVTVGDSDSMLIVGVTNNVTYPSGSYFAISMNTSFSRTGSDVYSIIIRTFHSGGSNVKLMATIFNNSGSSLTTSSTADVFTFRIRTIKGPRFS